MERKTIGILGGMGPAATVELFRRIVSQTPAQRDQDHLRVLIDNRPQIPDRGSFILGDGPDPRPMLIASARTLERMGADLIAIPCNTAHVFLADLQRSVRIPIIDMIAETAEVIRERVVGLLGTDTTIQTGLYHRACAQRGIDVITPEPSDQALVMKTIFRIKAGDFSLREEMRLIGKRLCRQGAEALIIGCTELSLVLGARDFKVPVYDALEILAKAALREAWLPAECVEPSSCAS
ncbi:MAG: amino acid racemase [Candidatus Bipolaricaulota bacterium]|nr:amino acid racemase [Candidatus Bipolaricaulota bacterium]MCS7275108.1 amino acid racemase [Candidatus Bipolaricaulota bacterium]MDW8110276.1 amino acid racemase [Candidatus Bipolaricaulota bacterium]MDW8328823.1 amino acid racemase [Candidatus Bipolaricaulota bacterium]